MTDGIVITGGYCNKPNSQCWKFAVPTMKWTVLPNINVARHLHATVCGGNQVYVLRGYDLEGMTLQSVEYLDEKNGSWHVSCDMPSGLYFDTAVSYKHFIYVFGGFSSQATFMLDTVSKKWSRKADMPRGWYRGSSVVYRDRIYVMSGERNCSMSYDPDQDQWRAHIRPSGQHISPSAVLWKDSILLCGGRGTSVIV